MIVTFKPVSPSMVREGAKALWDRNRELEGRVPWEEAAPWHLEPYERKAQLVLEAAIPQDAEFLKKFAASCLDMAEIL